MAQQLQGMRVAFIVANEGVEQVELTEPWKAVADAGAQPELVAPKTGTVQAMQHLDKGDTFEATRAASEVSAAEYDALVMPGGVANPDFLRMDADAVGFVRDMFQSGKPVAIICHGPWTAVEAGVLRGRRVTSWPSLRTDIVNAGGEWVDEQLVIDDNGPNVVVTSRKPDDLPAFCPAVVEQFARAASRTGAR
jgi:protease I